MMVFPIYIIVVAIAVLCLNVSAKHRTEPDYDHEHLACDMECMNDALCRYHSDEKRELQHFMQSGKMVQQCLCVGNWVGMACDVAQDENCQQSSLDCECEEADKLSVFAGEQCRRPFTEYCASLANSVGGHISFCTNGGKCKGDYLAAQISPGNTTANQLFQHTGCVCPPEFTGEHCELLNIEGYKLMKELNAREQNINVNKQTSEAEKEESFLVMGIILGVGLSSLFLMIANKCRRIRQQQQNNRLLGQSDCIIRQVGSDDILDRLPKIA